MTETHTFCRICEALCGLVATTEAGRVVSLRPNDRHVATEGFACVKGLRQHELYGSPDRLKTPLRRAGGALEPTSWDVALREVGRSVARIRDRHGPDAIAMYVGTAAGFGTLHPIFAQGFMTGVGSRSMYSSATQDCSNKFAVSRAMYGFPFTLTFPDLERTECLIVVGANPIISKWSFLQVPHPKRRLEAIEARGGKVYVVDPRRTETAKVAGEHVFIRPGTDVFFYLSFLCELAARGGVEAGRASPHLEGLSDVLALARAWPAARTAEVTGISAEKLVEMVERYRTARGAALYCSTGVNMGGHGALAFWLQEVINAASGNLDRAGGTLVGRGIFDFPRFGKRTGTLLRDDVSRVAGFASVNDAFPGGLLADEILTPGRGQVRALFVTGGNPLLTMPNAGRLREALSSLELLVVLDVLPTETASVATHVLPCTSPLERPDLPFIFPLFLGLQLRPYLDATRAVAEAPGEARDEASIYLALAREAGAPLFGSRVVQRALEGLARRHERRTGRAGVPQELLLSALLRASGNGGFDALAAEPNGRLRPPHAPGSFLGHRIYTKPDGTGAVQLAPPRLLEAARALDGAFDRERTDRRRLRLVTRRAVTTHNSWTHNLAAFVEGERGTNYLYLHPADAARLGLSSGDLADVSSDTATVRLPVRLLADLMEGTVALPHGWGHQRARGLSVASRTTGVNVNLLAADGPDALDRLSGMARLTAIPVDVRKADGPQDASDWSGVPAQGAR